MAVVSRIATLRIDDALTHSDDTQLTWVATADAQDTAAGGSVSVTIVRTKGGAATPDDPAALTLRYVDDGGTIIRTVALNTTAASQSDTFFFTSDGTSGGITRCGTIEMKLQATRAAVVAYDFETDGSPNSPPAGFHAHTLDRGWIRGTTTRTEAVSNDSAGGVLNEPAQHDESLFVRLTEGAVSYVARALTVASSVGSLSSATNSTTAAQRDVTFTTVVDERFAAGVTNVTWSITVPNAALTGLSDWEATTTTEADLDVDPRLTCTHHFQVEDDVFGLSKNDTTKQMLATQSGFIWTIIKGSRGTGVNSLTVTQTLDPDNAGTTISGSGSTSTQDSQAGVTARLDWTASKPGGSWQKSVDVTAPSDIDGATYLLSSTDTLTMLNVDPRFRAIISLCPTAAGAEGRHIEAGDSVTARATFYNAETFKRLAPDSGTTKILLIRFNIGFARFEYLASDGVTWVHWASTTTAADAPLMTDAGDGVTFSTTFTNTAGWTVADIIAIGVTGKIGGTPYSFYVQREVTGAYFRHDDSVGASVGNMPTAPASTNSWDLVPVVGRRAVSKLRSEIDALRKLIPKEPAPVDVESRVKPMLEDGRQQITVQFNTVITGLQEQQAALAEDVQALLALSLENINKP